MAVGGPGGTGGARIPRPVLRPGVAKLRETPTTEQAVQVRTQAPVAQAAPAPERVNVDSRTQGQSRQRAAASENNLRAQLFKEQQDVTAARGALVNTVRDAVSDGRLSGAEMGGIKESARNLRVQTRELELAQARVDLQDAQGALEAGGGRGARRNVAELQARVDSLGQVVDALGGNSGAQPPGVTVGGTQYRGGDIQDAVWRNRDDFNHKAQGVVWRLPKAPQRPGTSTYWHT